MTETDVNPARGRREGCLSGECYSRVWSVDMAYQRVGESWVWGAQQADSQRGPERGFGRQLGCQVGNPGPAA